MTAGTRSLRALSESASTSRVLNLSRVSELYKNELAYQEHPFFNDRILNRAIFVKHRLRSDETYLMPRSRAIATKIIFPFDGAALRSGGQSVFVGQKGFAQIMNELLGPSTASTRQDFALLTILEALPSLDPFILKEHLARHELRPADCYFDISAADMIRMRAFVSEQISALIQKAIGKENDSADTESVTRLVDALMSSDAGDRLDPLRLTLGLEGQAFQDGVFSWKGFLYYKWVFRTTTARLNRVILELGQVQFSDTPLPSVVEALAKKQIKLRKSIRMAAHECTLILALYDDAFRDLIEKGKAGAFKKFLLEAPRLFLDLGASMGTIAHIESYWRYRFPENEPLNISSAEFSIVINEFQQSLKPETTSEKSW